MTGIFEGRFVFFGGTMFVLFMCLGIGIFDTTTNEMTTTIVSPCDGLSGVRIANKTDTTCQTYLLCAFNYDTGDYESWTLICPGDLLFRPSTRTCVTAKMYQCPESIVKPKA